MPVQRKQIGKKAEPTRGEKVPTTRGRQEDGGGDDEGGGGGGKRSSKAALFDQTKAQGDIDNGKYEAIISEFVLQEEDEKGQSARIKYEIATDGDFRGQSLAQFYKVFEANGSVGKGAAFLKKDLSVLGYDDVAFDDLPNVMEEIVEKELGAVITVKHNAGFVNAYLGGLCEDSEIIADYIASRPQS